MRRGEMVAHRATSATSREELAELMVGRKVLFRVDKRPAAAGRPVLDVDGLRVLDGNGIARVDGVGFTVAAGEVVGLAGVRSEEHTSELQSLMRSSYAVF